MFEKISDTARTEIAEGSAHTDQFAESGRRKFITESVCASTIGTGHRPIGEQRPQRETFSFRQFQPSIRIGCLGDVLLAVHHALLDDEQTIDHPLVWRNDDLSFRVIPKMHAFEHPQHMIELHAVERCVFGDEGEF